MYPIYKFYNNIYKKWLAQWLADWFAMLKVYGLVVGNGRTVWARPRDVPWTVLSRSPRSTRSLHPPRSATRGRLETLIPINRGRKIPTPTPLIVTGTLQIHITLLAVKSPDSLTIGWNHLRPVGFKYVKHGLSLDLHSHPTKDPT